MSSLLTFFFPINMLIKSTIFSLIVIFKYNTYQVNDANLIVKDPLGNAINVQYVNLDNVTSNLRKFYTEAYLGQSSKQVPRYWLLFQVTVPPLGWNTYFISRAAGKGTCLLLCPCSALGAYKCWTSFNLHRIFTKEIL